MGIDQGQYMLGVEPIWAGGRSPKPHTWNHYHLIKTQEKRLGIYVFLLPENATFDSKNRRYENRTYGGVRGAPWAYGSRLTFRSLCLIFFNY